MAGSVQKGAKNGSEKMKLKTSMAALLAGMLTTTAVSTAFAANVDGPNVFWKISMWGNPRALRNSCLQMSAFTTFRSLAGAEFQCF